MSIFIHHGAPGSYKTSGALWLRLLPAIKSGRCLFCCRRLSQAVTSSRMCEA
ncbi:zonular occludens toxin domain-containing protein [Vibrio mimicus]|uniref:zonular occludens toxin domain-containing protein n=1 Tax=Vibrio mimicus TaxID=674 RepID=UPI0009B6ED85